MKNILLPVIIAIFGLLFLNSCAKNEEPTLGELQDISLKSWVELYDSDAEAYENGMYINKLRSSVNPEAKSPVERGWIKINYTGRTLNGDVYATREMDIAKQQGSYKVYQHYAPEFLQFYPYSGYYTRLPQGLHDALSMMKEGDLWRIYLPSRIAYGSEGVIYGQGYEGQYDLVGDVPVMIDMELVTVVENPLNYEYDQVMAHAMQVWGKPAYDTLKTGLYLQQYGNMGDTVTVKYTANMYPDRTVDVYYVTRFLDDGFVFDTNIEDTARKYGLWSPAGSFKPISVNVNHYITNTIDADSEETVYINGLYESLLGMKYGDTASAAFVSTYAYGISGYGYGEDNTIVEPYTPLIFDFITVSYGGQGNEDDPVFVAGVINTSGVKQRTWISGFIVGATDGEVKDARFEGPFASRANLILADNTTITDTNRVIAVDLPAGSAIEAALNLVDHPELEGRRVKIRGDIDKYLGGLNGVINPIEFMLE